MKETQTITKPASGHARESPSRVDTTRWLSNAAGRRIACAHSGTAFTQPDTIAYACNIRGELMNAVSNVDANYAYSYDYASFGAEIVPVGVEAEDSTTVHYSLSPIRCSNPWRFSSEFADDELGCDYYNYREYEPVTGRWMSRDLIDEDGGCCLYAFASNMPISRTDCLGAVAHGVIALGVASAVIYGCAWPQYSYAMKNFRGTGDKLRHCLASCRIAKTCGAAVADLVGLGKEARDRVVAYTCSKFPSLRDTDLCNGGHGDFFDSLNDLKANQACIGWETRVFGLVGSWIGSAFRQSCEDCCDCKIGKYNENDNWE